MLKYFEMQSTFKFKITKSLLKKGKSQAINKFNKYEKTSNHSSLQYIIYTAFL